MNSGDNDEGKVTDEKGQEFATKDISFTKRELKILGM